VGFTDLADFTALSERLKEQTVPLLGEYLGEMVPIIRKRGGYVNKFIGDGIMFFFGAFQPDPRHALDAVESVLEMHEALARFNQRLAREGRPTLMMRAGVNTGEVVVGDSGPPDASDFTALGDPVNFASRLESANKAVGTRV